MTRRAELAATTVHELALYVAATVPASAAVKAAAWFQAVTIRGTVRGEGRVDEDLHRRRAAGVLGRATVPRSVAAGHEVHGVARSPEKANQLRSQGATPVLNVELFDPASVRSAVGGSEAVVHTATSIPPLTKAWRSKRGQ
ncbi:MAG: NAD(P)H-binding protein [Ilumatobacteraceae bacterium]